jgi:pimeloyl-ACP methyl ester carboxylesterase
VRTLNVEPPAEQGLHEGLSFALFLPREEPLGSVVLLHGAGSVKENHFDFARSVRASGMAALVFDQRGHGASEGALDGGALDDVAAMAALARDRSGSARLALRGSSMGGYFALAAAHLVDPGAVVAICPAGAAGLARGLRDGRFPARADAPALAALLAQNDAGAAAAPLGSRLLLLHAEGDEQVPVEHSTELHRLAPGSKLVVVPGGHHRSVQHDPELQAYALRFVNRALRRGRD